MAESLEVLTEEHSRLQAYVAGCVDRKAATELLHEAESFLDEARPADGTVGTNGAWVWMTRAMWLCRSSLRQRIGAVLQMLRDAEAEAGGVDDRRRR